MAIALAKNPGLFSDRRVDLVWPDRVGNGGKTFPGYYLCAALAGLRSGVLPQQGLTNVAIVGFDDLSRTTQFFSANQLNTMAAAGYWIVTQAPDGVVYTRQQLTTDAASGNLKYAEQSITTNLDSISYQFLNVMKPYIGRGNVTPTMINVLSGAILGVISSLENTIAVQILGPQVLGATIVQLSQDPTFADRIICKINLELPAPLNNLELYLVA